LNHLLADALERFLSQKCAPQRVREIEAHPAGASARELWREINDSGYADALIPEAQGGAGLGDDEVALIAKACGRHAMPLPMALTIAVRAAAGQVLPAGPLTIAATPARLGAGPIVSAGVPYGLVADWVVLWTATTAWLLPANAASRIRCAGHRGVTADLRWAQLPNEALALSPRDGVATPWRAAAAALLAMQMAGAMQRMTEMSIAHANGRSQFGKPIGKRQAIQQQISVMAEQATAAHTAALIGLAGAGTQVDPLRAAVAKARAGEAALVVAAVSHAVHGAIGVTDEFDLQLYTRRLQEWRGQFGGETYWQERIGEALLEDRGSPLEFVLKLAGAPRDSYGHDHG
jgi:alkylation response protein AidB-like acyl-CoA dehydrogenase